MAQVSKTAVSRIIQSKDDSGMLVILKSFQFLQMSHFKLKDFKTFISFVLLFRPCQKEP